MENTLLLMLIMAPFVVAPLIYDLARRGVKND